MTTTTRTVARAARLCPEHARHVQSWRALHYDPRNPTEWPGGSHIMDSRTTHAERAAEWARKTAEQIEQVRELCQSGRSPQCDWPAPGQEPAPRPRRLVARNIPGSGAAVYDADTGENVSPGAPHMHPDMAAARAALRKLNAEQAAASVPRDDAGDNPAPFVSDWAVTLGGAR